MYILYLIARLSRSRARAARRFAAASAAGMPVYRVCERVFLCSPTATHADQAPDLQADTNIEQILRGLPNFHAGANKR
eukprot:6213367-Pleurochrysis_carterae.AAC.3